MPTRWTHLPNQLILLGDESVFAVEFDSLDLFFKRRHKSQQVENDMKIRFAVSHLVALLVISMVAPAMVSAQAMNGKWEVAGGTLHGKTIPSNVAYNMLLDISNTSFTANSGNLSSNGTITANPQISPAQVTFKIDGGDDSGRELKGIYKFEGQTMTITFSESSDFPADFNSTADNKYLTLTYQPSTGRATNNRNSGRGQIAGGNRGRRPAGRSTIGPPPAAPPQQNTSGGRAAFE